jgi:hypothetical protein
MKYVTRLFQAFLAMILRVRGFLPIWFAGLFIFIQFIINAVMVSFPYAFERLGVTIFAAELIINENVHKAILDSGYGFIQFAQILLALFILYKIIRFLTLVLVKVSGSQAEWGAMLISVFIVVIIEISTIKIVDGQFGFYPIYNGLWFLFSNLGPVLMNIF